MFEILSVIILYSRCDLDDKFQCNKYIMMMVILGLFDLYCYTEEIYMKTEEFTFMLEKLVTIIAQTLSLKRSYLNDIYKGVEGKLIP